MWFKKKEKAVVQLMELSGNDISTGMVGGYILKNLYQHKGFRNIGYRFVKNQGDTRIIIEAFHPSPRLVNYFKDRCPAIVEKEIQSSEQMAHDFEAIYKDFEAIYKDFETIYKDFETVIPYKN